MWGRYNWPDWYIIILHQPGNHLEIPWSGPEEFSEKQSSTLFLIPSPIPSLVKHEEHHQHLHSLWDHRRHRLGRVSWISTQWRSSSCLEVSLLVEVCWGWSSSIPAQIDEDERFFSTNGGDLECLIPWVKNLSFLAFGSKSGNNEFGSVASCV